MVRNDVEISQETLKGIPKEKERDECNDRDIMPPPAIMKERREEDNRSLWSERSGQSRKLVHGKGLEMGIGDNGYIIAGMKSTAMVKPASVKSYGS